MQQTRRAGGQTTPPAALATNQQASKQDQQILAAMAVLIAFVGFGSLAAVMADLVIWMGKFSARFSAEVIRLVANIVRPGIPEPGVSDTSGPAFQEEFKAAAAWRAFYILAALERLSSGGSVETEQGYYEQHVEAEERRLRSAALVDRADELLGNRTTGTTLEGLLGWRSVLDKRTTSECRMAHGRNFRVDRMPLIGWPGAVHVNCRCSAGPPIPGAPLLPTI